MLIEVHLFTHMYFHIDMPTISLSRVEFVVNGQAFMCSASVRPHRLKAGKLGEVLISFDTPGRVLPLLTKGMSFSLLDEGREIGTGTVVRFGREPYEKGQKRYRSPELIVADIEVLVTTAELNGEPTLSVADVKERLGYDL